MKLTNLFREFPFHTLRDPILKDVRAEVERTSEEEILRIDEDEFVEYVARKHGLEPVVLDVENLTVEDDHKMLRSWGGGDMVKVPCYWFHLPFTGDERLLRATPSQWSTRQVMARIEHDEIIFDVDSENLSMDEVGKYTKGVIGFIQHDLGSLSEELAKLDFLIRQVARDTFRARRDTLVKKAAKLKALGVTVRSVSGQEDAVSHTREQIEKLRRLRDKLASIPAEPWSGVDAWIAEATPTIEYDWWALKSAFRDLSKRPRWTVSLSGSASEKAAAANRKKAQDRHAKLLAFCDGILMRETGLNPQAEEGVSNVSSENVRNVFVVYGRNEGARKAMFEFLRAVGLNPMEWDGLIAAHGDGTPHPTDVIETGFSIAQAIVVLLTPDDEARLRDEHHGSHEEDFEAELTGQPRPNVLFEAGMAFGISRKRTIIVEIGRLRPVSDIAGRHTIRMNGSAARRNSLVTRLQTAGCPASKDSHDWLTAGDFDGVLASLNEKKPLSSGRKPSEPETPKLFHSDGLLWSEKWVGDKRIYIPHCPTCESRLTRKADFVECSNCGFEELSTSRQPRDVPPELGPDGRP